MWVVYCGRARRPRPCVPTVSCACVHACVLWRIVVILAALRGPSRVAPIAPNFLLHRGVDRGVASPDLALPPRCARKRHAPPRHLLLRSAQPRSLAHSIQAGYSGSLCTSQSCETPTSCEIPTGISWDHTTVSVLRLREALLQSHPLCHRRRAVHSLFHGCV